MAYKVSLRSSFNKDFKGFDQKTKVAILGCSKIIEADPHKAGISLGNNMKGFYKLPFNRKPELRIIFAVYSCLKSNPKTKQLFCEHEIEHTPDELLNCNGLIEYIWIKTREECNNLYSMNKKYYNKFKRK